MNAEERSCCKLWIKKNIAHHTRKQANSYFLKHVFQRFTNIYSTDCEFQEVMLECGFIADEKYHSWFFARLNPEMFHSYFNRDYTVMDEKRFNEYIKKNA